MRPVLDERLVAALGPRSPGSRARASRRSRPSRSSSSRAARSASFYDHALSVCAAAGFAPRIVQEANELFTVISLVRAGLGVSLVPRSAALMRLPGVRFRELTLPEAAWNIAMAWHRDSADEPLVRRFVEMVSRGSRDIGFASPHPKRYHASNCAGPAPSDHRPRGPRPAWMAGRPRRRADACGGPAAAAHHHQADPGALSGRRGARLSRSASAASSPTSTSRHDVTLIVHDGEFGQFVATPADPRTGRVRGTACGAATSSRSRDEPSAAASPRTFCRLRSGSSARRRCRGPSGSPSRRCSPDATTATTSRSPASSSARGRRRDQRRTRCSPTSPSRTAWCARRSGTTPARTCTRFIDARVQLRGNVGALFGRTEQLRGVSLFVGRTSDIAVLESAPDPFSLPTRSIRSIYNYSAAGEVNRRIRVRGVVTALHSRPSRRGERLHEHGDASATCATCST